MTARSLLEQILKSGSDAMGGSEMSKYGTGAAVGGALAMLLGPKRGASRKLLQVGSVAALGALAWRAYQDHQARQAAAGQAPAAVPSTPAAAVPSFDRLPAPQAEQHSQAMLKAMIAAAKSDGHLDDRERGLLEGELHRLDADPAMRAWVDAELRRPVEPAEVAAAAASPEIAAEIYLATLLVVDDKSTMERAYLEELARHLKLPPALKADLEARAAAGV
ncbi:MAG: tellurite resistance TerB family protein [Rubrivivax sp.]|nr:tellurite resistance TerB family protein [Rubrivivax sp.]